jgi:hypothetical protein
MPQKNIELEVVFCSSEDEDCPVSELQSPGPRDRFDESPFRPETFRADFYPQILDKVPSKSSRYKFI